MYMYIYIYTYTTTPMSSCLHPYTQLLGMCVNT